ncbi:MAG TPA: hypothetical protein VNG35_12310 [Gemmatimonadales bacterium]|nr:hypothetical protein [Gemmatimonadales bacterium]
MNSVPLKRLTSFEFAVGIGYLEVWVNPATVAYVQPRRQYDSKSDRHSFNGSLIYFQQEAGVLAVRDEIGYVVATLQSGKGGVCRDCYQILEEAWATLCSDCCRTRHKGVHPDPEEVPA